MIKNIKYYCIICGKEIHSKTWTEGSKMCGSCSAKKRLLIPENNSNYIDGRSKEKHFCIDCGKNISYNCWVTGNQLCKPCFTIFRHKFGDWKNRKPPQVKGFYYKNIYMRSSWEIVYAKYLDSKNIKWLYESKTFDLGSTTYTPDFYLPKYDQYIEIKGWWRNDAINKFNFFKQKYPNIKIIVLEKLYLKSLRLIK